VGSFCLFLVSPSAGGVGGFELFFGFYFLGGGDFPGRVKCLPITRRFKRTQIKWWLELFSGDLFRYF